MVCTFCEEGFAALLIEYQQDENSKRINICKSCYTLYKNEIHSLFPFVRGEVEGVGKRIERYVRRNSKWKRQDKQRDAKVKKVDEKIERKETNEFLSRLKCRNNVYGRDKQIEQTVLALKRKEKNAPLLLGHQGTGKTAIVEAVAEELYQGEWRIQGKRPEIWELHLDGLLKNTGMRGQLEERISSLIRFLKVNPHIILFVDEIHMLWSQKGDLANYLKPPLARGEIKMVGATTYREYKEVLRDAAFERRVQIVHVPEPDVEQTYVMLKSIVREYEKYHNVSYTKKAILSCVNLANLYLPNRYFPDKAIDLLDITGASYQGEEITEKHVEKITQKLFRGINKETWKETVEKLQSDLLVNGIGEVEALMVRNVLLANGIVRERKKPFCSFVCEGEINNVMYIAERLAVAAYGTNDVFVVDLKEYTESHSISKLVGAPPGYVGHQNGGILTNVMQTEPSQVLLFLNWDAAHIDVQGVVRKIIENGSIRDNEGNELFFHNTIVIVTKEEGEPVVGFSDSFQNEREKGFDVRISWTSKQEDLIVVLKEFKKRWKNVGVNFYWSPEIEDQWGCNSGVKKKIPKKEWEQQMVDEYLRHPQASAVFIWVENEKMHSKWVETEENVCIGSVG